MVKVGLLDRTVGEFHVKVADGCIIFTCHRATNAEEQP